MRRHAALSDGPRRRVRCPGAVREKADPAGDIMQGKAEAAGNVARLSLQFVWPQLGSGPRVTPLTGRQEQRYPFEWLFRRSCFI